MSKISDRLILSIVLPLIIGCVAIMPVIYSENGYVAGFVFFPLFLLVGAASLILFVIGLIGLASKSKSAAWLLLSAILLPASFISLGLVAKFFELGAYRQEPMTSISDGVNNIVVSKEGTTNAQINDIWEKTMSLERADGKGYEHLPGLGTMMQIQSRNGHEAMAFGFFSSASEEQRQVVFSKVKSSPIVYQLLENQSVKEYNADFEKSSSAANSNKPTKKVLITNSTNSK